MANYKVNTPYLQHSTPEYNAAHKKENSEYNAKYYQAHKEKWGVDSDSKSGTNSSSDDDKDKKKKKTSTGKSMAEVLSKLNGGSKAIGKGSSKKSASKSSGSKEKKSDEEKEAERLKKEEAKKAKQEEKEKRNAEKELAKLVYQEELARRLKDAKRRRKELERIYKEKKALKEKRAMKNKNYVVTVRGKTSIKHIDLDGNYLMHHGIDNQKWGVRHGPPYPLAKGVANAIKKGAEKGLKEGRKNAVNYVVQGSVRPVSDRIQKKKNPQKFDAKKLATGALVIAGSALATGIITKLVDYGIDKAVDGGKVAAGHILMNAPHEGLANVGVNILLDAARTRR